MIDSGLSDVASRLLRRSQRAISAAHEQRQREEGAAARAGSRDARAIALVLDVAGAQLVAVRDSSVARAVRGRRLTTPAAASRRSAAAKRSPSRKSRLPCATYTGTPASRDAAQRCGDARRERLAQLVVADPPVEQVAEDVDRGGRRAPGRRRTRGTRAARRALRREVQVGEEQRRASDGIGCYQRLPRPCWITTSSPGRPGGRRCRPVGTPLILSTTSVPSTTLPNTAVAPALRARPLVVEEVVVGDVDEELRGRRMRVAGARHRDRVLACS